MEENNWLARNLAAFVHVIGTPASGWGQEGTMSYASPDRINPTDAAASGFYVPNANNALKDNAASGGFAGFNFPRLEEPTEATS